MVFILFFGRCELRSPEHSCVNDIYYLLRAERVAWALFALTESVDELGIPEEDRPLAPEVGLLTLQPVDALREGELQEGDLITRPEGDMRKGV